MSYLTFQINPGQSGDHTAYGSFPSLAEAFESLKSLDAEFVLVCKSDYASRICWTYCETLTGYDMVHAGLNMGMMEVMQVLQVTTFSWFFLNPVAGDKSVSWKAHSGCWLLRPRVIETVGSLHPHYQSPEIALADFCYRLLRSGGRVYADPGILVHADLPEKVSVPIEDSFRFIRRHVSRQGAWLALACQIFDLHHGFGSIGSFYKSRHEKPCKILKKLEWLMTRKRERLPYSAIIPTINRYDYLPAAIESLLAQPFPPDEIVIYDQTPAEKRIPAIYQRFDPLVVKVIYSDKPGQSTARNTALRNTTHEWCLLFDDDSKALPEMMEHHWSVIQSGFPVSTGASLAPGKKFEDLPYDVNFYHFADVLDTGNCFTSKKTLEEAGWLDPAFDRGPGADNDLGTRIYLKGIPIVYNPGALRIHYKATSGGLRTFGVWWRFKTTLMGPYPPPSQTYTVRRFYPPPFRKYLYLRFYFKAAYRQNFFQLLLLWLLAPFKLTNSLRQAKALERKSKT